jgi:predicted Zn-dependent peptidase
MVATLLTKGANGRTADEVATLIESAGGSFQGFAGTDDVSLAGNVLSNQTALAMQLLADAVTKPTFAEREVELVRTQALSALRLEEGQPGAIAQRAFNAALYGAHPYGRAATPATVRAITRADLLAFHGRRVKPRGALLVVAGDVTMAQLRPMLERAFAGWTGAPAATPTLPAPPARARSEIVLVHRPGSVQSNIVAGNLTAGPADPTRYAATIANKLLGGGADARLFTILREQKGWTYGAYSNLTRPRGTGAFSATAEVRTEVTDSALVEMLGQLRRLGSESVSAADLDNARSALVGRFPLTVETAQQIAEQVAQVKTLGLPGDYLQTYRTRLAAVSAADLQDAARRYVRPEQALVVVVGDGAKVYDRLRAIAPVRIVNAQGDALTPADLAAVAAAAAPPALDVSKLVARRDSFTVLVQGNPAGYATSVVERTAAGGWSISGTSSLMGGMVAQSATLTTDAKLAATKLTSEGRVQGQPLKTEVTFASGRATGNSTEMTPQGPKPVTVDAAVPAGALDQTAIAAALTVLPWKAGAAHTLALFDPARTRCARPPSRPPRARASPCPRARSPRGASR